MTSSFRPISNSSDLKASTMDIFNTSFARYALALLLGLATTFSKAATRTDSLINFDWKFMIGDVPAAKEKTFADSKWQQVNLPHDGSIAGGFDTVSGTRQKRFPSTTHRLVPQKLVRTGQCQRQGDHPRVRGRLSRSGGMGEWQIPG